MLGEQDILKKMNALGKVTPFIKKRGKRDFLGELEMAEKELEVNYKRFKTSMEKRDLILKEYLE